MWRYVFILLIVLLALPLPAEAARSMEELRMAIRTAIRQGTNPLGLPPPPPGIDFPVPRGADLENAMEGVAQVSDIPALMAMLGERDPVMVEAAIYCLSKLGQPALDAMYPVIEAADKEAQAKGRTIAPDSDLVRATKMASDATALNNLPFDRNEPAPATDADRKEAEAMDPAFRALLEKRYAGCADRPVIYAARKEGDFLRLWYEMHGVSDVKTEPVLDSDGNEIRNHDMVETKRTFIKIDTWGNGIYNLKSSRFIGWFKDGMEASMDCGVH